MSTPHNPWDDRAWELAIQAFTDGLDPAEQTELEAVTSPQELERFEQEVAALTWAHLPQIEQPPKDLLVRLEKTGMEWIEAQENSQNLSPVGRDLPQISPPSKSAAPWWGWAGWAAALALFVIWYRSPGEPAMANPAAQMAALLDQARDVKEIPWSLTEDPLASGATGKVLWSPSRQEGYMVFENLRGNDPTQTQFQLWIFDASRVDWEAKPVDGGVFDVNGEGQVVVPIQAKLSVQDAKLFAVTLEQTGGVVVSEREHLLLTAAVDV